MDHHLELGLASKQKGNLQMVLKEIQKKIKKNSKSKRKLLERKKRVKKFIDSAKEKLLDLSNRNIKVQSELDKEIVAKKKILKEIKKAKITGAKKATIDNLDT